MRDDTWKGFVAENRRGVLTTFRRDGAAQMSIVTCGPYREGVAFTTTEDRAKLHNLRRRPQCSLLVARENWAAYIVLQGAAQVFFRRQYRRRGTAADAAGGFPYGGGRWNIRIGRNMTGLWSRNGVPPSWSSRNRFMGAMFPEAGMATNLSLLNWAGLMHPAQSNPAARSWRNRVLARSGPPWPNRSKSPKAGQTCADKPLALPAKHTRKRPTAWAATGPALSTRPVQLPRNATRPG